MHRSTYLLIPFLAINIAPPILTFLLPNEQTHWKANQLNAFTRVDLVSTGGAWRYEWVKNGLKSKRICQLGVVPPLPQYLFQLTALSLYQYWKRSSNSKGTGHDSWITKQFCVYQAWYKCYIHCHTHIHSRQVSSTPEDKMHNDPFRLLCSSYGMEVKEVWQSL